MSENATEHLDVLIVGAGLSGIGAAAHIVSECPGKSFAILEARAATGGTWDLFRYPGIRSDSDMFTLGYSFRPWKSAKSIADGGAILDYIRDTAREYGLEDHVRLEHRVTAAEWSSGDARWTVTVERGDSGESFQLTCGFLYMCTGYYRYDEGYTPEFAGRDDFKGQIVHPQHWPEDLDYEGKRIVVIGSGATAVTLVPSLAERAAHVTMLQRSPTYIVTMPGTDRIAELLQRRLPARLAYGIARWKNVLMSMASFNLSRRAPKLVRTAILRMVKRQLPAGVSVREHFAPSYDPWDQRICLVPDGDLFKSIRGGRARVVTGAIRRFVADGIELESGERLDADMIVTATGLNLLALGGTRLIVDGEEVDPGHTVGYKGVMLSGVPNLAMTLGYTNASWTLKADLAAGFVSRLLNHMDRRGFASCVPRWPEPQLPGHRFIDLQSGYVLRSIEQLPRQGDERPWRLYQNYLRDIFLLGRARFDDPALEFGRRAVPVRPQNGEPPIAVAAQTLA